LQPSAEGTEDDFFEELGMRLLLDRLYCCQAPSPVSKFHTS